MKTGALRDVKARLSHYIAEAKNDYLLITRHGKPAALVLGVEGYDMEDVFYMTSAPFWKGMAGRRGEKALTWRRRHA